MNTPVELPPVGAKGLIVLSRIQFEAYQKSRRIIAELAKVRDGMYEPFDDDVSDAYYNCRAIAEE